MNKELNGSWTPRFKPEQEYQSLREELLQAKKYVFERPLVIAALAVAGLKFLELEYLFILPLTIALLLIFNFWFTINRLLSAARIVAYIQLELEEANFSTWVGWETSLRYYRKWLKATPNVDDVVETGMDQEAIPDALMYYPPIYFFHIGMLILSVIGSLIIVSAQYNSINIGFALATIIIGCISVRYFYINRPGLMREQIERNRVIWSKVFDVMKTLGKRD